MGRARRLAWEPESVPRVHHDSQPSSTLEGQVHHHLVQEMYLWPTVAELQALRQRRPRWHAWYLLCHHYLQPVQELPESPVLELQPASRASVPAEPEDVPAVASVPVLAVSTWDIPGVLSGPEMEPHDPSGPGPRAPAGMASGQGEPDLGLEPTSPCAASTWDIPGVLSGPEMEPHDPSGPGPRAPAGMASGQGEPDLGLEPTSPCAASTWDIPGVLSGPEMEPHDPSGPGPRAPAGMASGQGEPDMGLDPTSPCAASTWDIPGVVSGPKLERHDPWGPGPRAPAGMASGQGEPDVGLESTRPCAMSTQDMWMKEEPPILVFAPRLVAEQLTLMCAELFMKVRHSECQAYLWHQPQTGTIEHIAPTIHKVMEQIEATVRLVTTSCLGTPSMTAQDRARVVEFWIRVAEECWYLRNHAALHAIVSALQRPAIRHLDSTWRHVSWESSWIYKKLKKTDKGVNRKQLLEEARAIVKQQLWALRASQDMKKQGMVPFLGVFLDDLLADQLPEHDEDGDGMRERASSAQPAKVTNILYQIMMHKRVARLYDLEPNERFQSFLQTVELLDADESYTLSCQLEPPGQGPGNKGVLQLYRSHV